MDIRNLKYVKQFISHNLINYKKKTYKNSNKILVEVYDYKPSTIPISYLSNILAQKYQANIVGYYSNFPSMKKKFKTLLEIFNPYDIKKIYKSFGVEKFIIPKKSKHTAVEVLFTKIFKKINTKEDVLDIKFDGIVFGDLIYDEFLRSSNRMTINITSKQFQYFLKDAISLYLFWKNIFKLENFKSVIISHHVYFMGFVSRIAIFKNIPVYSIGITNIQYLTKLNQSKHCAFKSYSEVFKKFDISLQKKLLIDAEKKLTNRFSGEKDIKLLMDRHTDRDFYNKNISTKKILSKNRFKVLISAHQFSDAVHVYGYKFLFDDFYEWIDFLGKCIEKTDYDWYIKFHPSEHEKNYKHINYFSKKYPKFKILPNDVTNNQLIKEKIDIVLTVYGSVGHEYPLFGIPVINASNEGPHKSFDFNVYPKNFKEYEKIILNLDKVPKVKVKLIKRKIYLYYLMRFLLEYNLINNFKGTLIKLGSDYPTGKIYDVFLKQLKKENNNNELLKVYKDFINSKKYRIYSSNLNIKTELIGFY